MKEFKSPFAPFQSLIISVLNRSINECLAIDSVGNISEYSSSVIDACLERSRVGVGMITSARGDV